MASKGFLNNNYGNIIYMNGTDWEGSTGITYTTGDGNENVQFRNGVYGIRALMVIINTFISKHNIYNISDILRRYSPKQSDEDIDKRARLISKKYFNGALPEDDILDLGDKPILGLTKGIIESEIPEYGQIPDKYWDIALRYFNSYDDTEANAIGNTLQSNLSSDSSATSSGIMWLLLLLAGGGAIYLFSRKK